MIERNSRAVMAPDEGSVAFYRDVLRHLLRDGVPFLVGGGYAFRHYTGIDRITRDFDVFMSPEGVPGLLERLASAGMRVEMVFPHWLAKIRSGDDYVDIIFSSGNGLARVDPIWFEHATDASVLDIPVKLCPIEEMIWSKGFIMERERFDGADIVHLIHAVQGALDWNRLRARFGPHGRVLLAHLLMFGYVYPGHRHEIPVNLMRELFDGAEPPDAPRDEAECRGTLLSRSQYLPDLERGYHDARLAPAGSMTPEQIALWTEAADVPPPHG